MLHKETVEPAALGLIRTLLADPAFNDFILVGGTALSLQIGHRISYDIDLFSRNEFDAEEMSAYLEKQFGFSLQYMHHNTLKGFINSVFIDVLRHNYPMVSDPVEEDGIKMASAADIAAMKLNAISGNGTRAIIEENWPNLILEKSLTLKNLKKAIINHRDQFLKENLKGL